MPHFDKRFIKVEKNQSGFLTPIRGVHKEVN